MADEPRRALILAGGGIRVAWQAGVVQALDEAGLRFDHGDGTSGGIFTLGMLLSGVAPSELGARWRSLRVLRFVSMLPLRDYVRLPTSWPAFGGPAGVRDVVLPHLGVDVHAIRASTGMTGSFNVADFDDKVCVAVPHDEIDLERLVAGVSLPIFLPAVDSGGRTWTDAVWIKDANLLEAVRRGCDELWVVWCIGNSPRWGTGPLEQYVHMIELSANGALAGELAQIAEINERRARGEAVHGSTAPIAVHVVTPRRPLPLDPDFVAGRISAEALVAMGYRDAWSYLERRPVGGGPLDHTASKVAAAPLGCRLSVRLSGAVGASLILELADLDAFVADPAGADVIGGIDAPAWGYRPFVDGRVGVTRTDEGRSIVVSATVRVGDDVVPVTMATTLPDRGMGRRRWRVARQWTIVVGDRQGTARVGRRDALRVVTSFEPSGAHSLGDRWRVARTFTRFLR
ncbi:MAG: patatin-like phospholipase family protein [Nocardioides sp.]